MKKNLVQAFSILFILLAIPMVTFSIESDAIKHGFRGIKWGADIAELEGLIPDSPPSKYNMFNVKKSELEFSSEKLGYLVRQLAGNVFIKKSDVLGIKNINLKGTYYTFWAGKFYKVNIDFECKYFKDILKIYENRYGKFEQFGEYEFFGKQIGDVQIRIGNTHDKYCPIVYTYLPILNERKKDRDNYYKEREKEKNEF